MLIALSACVFVLLLADVAVWLRKQHRKALAASRDKPVATLATLELLAIEHRQTAQNL